MRFERFAWVAVASFGTGWEADLAVARLGVEEVPARSRGNGVTGIFGPGFQGATPRGFLVEVPAPFAAQARYILANPPPPIEDGDTA